MTAVVSVSARKKNEITQSPTEWMFQFREQMIKYKIVDPKTPESMIFANELSSLWLEYASDEDGVIWMSPKDALDEELTYWGD